MSVDTDLILAWEQDKYHDTDVVLWEHRLSVDGNCHRSALCGLAEVQGTGTSKPSRLSYVSTLHFLLYV